MSDIRILNTLFSIALALVQRYADFGGQIRSENWKNLDKNMMQTKC